MTSPVDIFLSDPVKERLCLELSWIELANLIVSKNLQSFPCRKVVNDKDGNIKELQRIDKSTIALARYIEAIGSNDTLSYLILSDNSKLVRLLLEAGMDVSQERSLNLSYATITSLEMVQLLLEFGTPLTQNEYRHAIIVDRIQGKRAHRIKISNYEFDPVRIQSWIESKKKSVNFIAKPLFAAIEANPDVEIIRTLIERRELVNDIHQDPVGLIISPLFLAILKRKDYPEIVQLLLEAGANVDFLIEGMTIIEISLRYHDLGLFKLLLKYQSETSTEIRNRLVLPLISDDNNYSGLQYLLRKGVNSNYLNSQNPSLLFIAINNKAFRNTELLLKFGVDPNLLTNAPPESTFQYKTTALNIAIYQKLDNFVDLLLKFKADPYRKDERGMNSFDIAFDPRLISSPILEIFSKYGLKIP